MLGLLVGLAVIALPAIATEVHPCHGLEHGWGLHLRSCNSYWNCEEHPPRVHTCRNNGYFHVGHQRCVSHEQRQCLTCPKRGHTLYSVPRPQACHQFIRCWNGQPTLHSCPRGLVFDGRTRQCNWPTNGGCHNSGWDHNDHDDGDHHVNYVCPSNVHKNGLPLFLRGRGTCDHYYVCWAPNTHPSYGRCPEGLHFNLREGVCDHPANADCVS